jgi:hypothetical protein
MTLATGTVYRRARLGPPQAARDAIVAALGLVPGLNPRPTIPEAPGAFDAFPRWALTNYVGGRLGEGLQAQHEYDVLVILPAGYEPDTVAQGDALLDQVATALATVALVRQADPIQLAAPNGATGLPALRVRVVPHLTTTTTTTEP